MWLQRQGSAQPHLRLWLGGSSSWSKPVSLAGPDSEVRQALAETHMAHTHWKSSSPQHCGAHDGSMVYAWVFEFATLLLTIERMPFRASCL